jgi:gliding motility-associated-like protein
VLLSGKTNEDKNGSQFRKVFFSVFIVTCSHLQNKPTPWLIVMIRILVLLLLLSTFTSSAISQLPVFQWAKSFKANNAPNNYSDNTNGRTVGVDAQGNVYSAGLFFHTVDFDPGVGVYNLTSGTPYGSIYISKLDANGNFVWAEQIPQNISFSEIELKVTSTGIVYLVAYINTAVDMDPGPGVQTVTPVGYQDAFILKIDTNGNLLWVKTFGGAGTDTGASGLVLDLDKFNNVIVCGWFSKTVDFDPGPGIYNLTSSAHIQSFIAKLDINGNLVWAKQFGNGATSNQSSLIADVKCDSLGNIHVIGQFQGICDFDPGAGVYNLQGTSYSDVFVSRLDANGNLVWARQVNGPVPYSYSFFPKGLDVDAHNNVISTGSFTGTVDLDPGAGTQIISASPHDCYIMKLNPQGNLLWAATVGAPGNSDMGHDLVVDQFRNIYLIGGFGPGADFDPGPGSYVLNAGGPVLAKYDATGGLIYALPYTSINSGGAMFRRMAIDLLRNLYIAGSLSGQMDFDPNVGVFSLTGSSNSSPFVHKLGSCANPSTSDLYITTCETYTLNDQTYDSSNTYLQIIPNLAGCDSLIRLHLTVTKRFNEQTIEICQGASFFAGGSLQTNPGTYLDTLQTALGCDSIVSTHLIVHPNPQPDLGSDKNLCEGTTLSVSPGIFKGYLWQDNSTSANFSISATGVYWVKVTNSFGCSATDTFTVSAIVPPPANFLPEKDSICMYGSLELFPSAGFSSYYWSTTAISRTIVVNARGNYWLKVTDLNGCTGVDTIAIYPKQCMYGVYFPTAFTPNRDGKNDHFKALVFGKVQSFRLRVFDRWGQLMFQTDDPVRRWDGTNKGNDLATGVFVWQCSYQIEGQDKRHEKGTVVLIK